MRSGFGIGRIFGIDIRIDWSWIFIFLLVTWNLSAAVFPQIHPDWSFGLILATAVAAALLFFASVLAHELAHSLVARASGLPVRNITLFLFGGVSNIEREPPSPRTEFLIAVVGPITSVVLGVLFLLIGSGMADMGGAIGRPMEAFRGLNPLTTLLLWLGPVNIIVGVFNLIPGFPLDGGRIVRAILWGATGSLRQATQWASWLGQAIGWLFIIVGIAMVFGARIPFFGTGLGGLWLAFIGWFLNSAAIQSYQQVAVQDVLEGVPVGRLMRPQVETTPADISVSGLVHDHIMGTDQHAFPVLRGEDIVGIVCLHDVRSIPRDRWDATAVTEIMTPAEELEVTTPREDAVRALERLTRRDVNQLPVVEGGRLVGILRRQDIIRWLQTHSDGLAP